MKSHPPYLRSAYLIEEEEPEEEEPKEEKPEEEEHWSDYWFEEAPAEGEEGEKEEGDAEEESEEEEEAEGDQGRSGYPFNLPAVLALPEMSFGEVTILVGDNGSGKSTLVEGLALAAGFNPEGGSRNLKFETNDTHSRLSEALRLEWSKKPRWGWFFRAETFYGMATHIERDNDPQSGVASIFPDLHNRSHGESFLTLAESRLSSKGLYFLDEVESALSFHGQLRLMRIMQESCAKGAQFIMATHSPLLMAFPGAKIYELTDSGATEQPYDKVEAVQMWRRFLDAPERVFRDLFGEDEVPLDG